MIEIKEKVEQVVYFPKNSNEVLEIYSLELHSELTQKSYTFSVVDSGNSNRYYKFTVDFSGVEDGEYNYSISGQDTGLIRIGEIHQNYSISFDDDVEVIQYGLNVRQRYQHKELNINQNAAYLIIPDDGYDALSKVTAYVNVPQTGHTDEELEEAYKSGYTEGWKDGYSSVVPDAVDYTKLPLTFNVLSAGTINWTASNTGITKTIEYKLNDGEWKSITSETVETAPTINVVEGDIVQFRGNNESYAVSGADGCRFIATARFNVYGNIMSLINSTSFSGITSIGAFAFAILFSGNGVVSAENLILPATTLAESCYQNMFIGCDLLTVAPKLPATTLAYRCYRSMFYYCTSLTKAPELPATTLPIQCYSGMFEGCISLNYIKCLATDISATYCTDDWVNGVASTGTFVKNPDMASWSTGSNGIPTGWAVQNA